MSSQPLMKNRAPLLANRYQHAGKRQCEHPEVGVFNPFLFGDRVLRSRKQTYWHWANPITMRDSSNNNKKNNNTNKKQRNDETKKQRLKQQKQQRQQQQQEQEQHQEQKQEQEEEETRNKIQTGKNRNPGKASKSRVAIGFKSKYESLIPAKQLPILLGLANCSSVNHELHDSMTRFGRTHHDSP